MKNVGAFFRSFCSFLVIILIGLPIAAALNLWMILANYLSLALTFEMLGLDTVPLGEDKLLGSLFSGLAADASLVNLIGASLACVVTVGFFLLVRQLLEMWDHWKQLRLQSQAGNETEVTARRLLIRENLLWLALLLPLVVCFAHWDMEMFRFRAVLGAGQIHDTATAVTVANWGKVMSESADLYAVTLAKVGMWGYLAVNLMACFVLEFAMVKARDKFQQMTAIASSWFEMDEQESAKPMNEGHHFQGTETSRDTENGGALPATEPPADIPGQNHGTVLDPGVPVETIPEPSAPPNETRAHAGFREDAREVIGGEPEERISLDEAVRQRDRYFVDIKNGQVWDRRHWESLHGAEEEKELSNAAA